MLTLKSIMRVLRFRAAMDKARADIALGRSTYTPMDDKPTERKPACDCGDPKCKGPML